MSEFNIELFGEKLKFLRERYEMSQQETADTLGVAVSDYCDYEQGKAQPDLETLYKISQNFLTSIDYMLDPKVGVTFKLLEKLEETDFDRYYTMAMKYIKKFDKILNL